MDLVELNDLERLVLVGMLCHAVGHDARVSSEESAVIMRVATALGDDAYRASAAECGRRFRTVDELLLFAPVVQRPAARALIYETLVEAAMPDAIDADESRLLGRLARMWDVDARMERPHGTR